MEIKTIQTEGWFIRINYWSGDVLDQGCPNEAIARHRAREGSHGLRADIDVCHGARVVATFRAGQDLAMATC